MARMRALCPVARSEEYGGFWVVTRYEDALGVAQDWATFSSAHGLSVSRIADRGPQPPGRGRPARAAHLQAPRSTRTSPPRPWRRWEQPTRALVTRLIDGFVEDGACDFMDGLRPAVPRPGVLRARARRARRGPGAGRVPGVEVLDSQRPRGPRLLAGPLPAGSRTSSGSGAASQPPRGDVVDAVLNAAIDGRPITEDEIIGTVQLLILGGLETTAGALGLMVLRFCREPRDPRAAAPRAGADPGRRPGTAAARPAVRLRRPHRGARRRARRPRGSGRATRS